MSARRIAQSFVLNVTAAAAGLAGTLFITWFFGLAEFAYYTINAAKLSLILLGAELLPSSFTVFRLQEDRRFTAAVPVFYLAFAICAAALAGLLIGSALLNHWSWFMLLFVFNAALQRYFDTQAQASGRVDAYFWIPAATNIARLLLLLALSRLRFLSAETILWASIALAGIIGQTVMISRFPEFLDRTAYRQPLAKFRYLWSIRSAYYEYYANSLLKRLRDTFIPLFSDLTIPSKAVIGHLLVFTRASETVCGQVRVLEAFMVNRAIRENLRHARRLIIITVAPLGQFAIVTVALLLLYRHGIAPGDVVLALITGLFVYPYILELFWRNDALAEFRPRQVTASLLAFLAGLSIPPVIAWAFGSLDVLVLLIGYIFAQTLAAASYRLYRAPSAPAFESRAQ